MPDIPDWLQQWLKTVSAWDLALWGLGIALSIWLIRRFVTKGWPALKAFAKAILHFAEIVNAVQDLPAFITRTDTSIATMRRQIENDHKSNMRDDITDAQETAKRVEEGVRGLHDKVDERFKAMQEQIDELHAADDELRDDIEKTQPKPTEGES